MAMEIVGLGLYPLWRLKKALNLFNFFFGTMNLFNFIFWYKDSNYFKKLQQTNTIF
jgi:hypothetical protein